MCVKHLDTVGICIYKGKVAQLFHLCIGYLIFKGTGQGFTVNFCNKLCDNFRKRNYTETVGVTVGYQRP